MKRLSLNNWLERDPTLPSYVRYRDTNRGLDDELGKTEWAEEFLAYSLPSYIPIELQRLFEVARGAMLYGFFFYPLYTVGLERVYQLLETAVRRKYDDLGGPRRLSGRRPTYGERIDWLVAKGVIDARDASRWHAAREIRNVMAHPGDQMIALPTDSLRRLAEVVHDLDALFAPASGQ